jgi:GNAT superfamily N-acetyltransferase
VALLTHHPLAPLLGAAAQGTFPAADGTLDVVPAPAPLRAAVVAFTAHSVVAADLEPDEVRAHLPDNDFGAPMSPAFLAWLGQRLGATPGVLDVVLVHLGTANGSGSLPLVPFEGGQAHPRVARAFRLRQEVRVFTEPQARGLVTVGRGLVGRWEISLELDPAARGQGLGRAMISAARTLVPADEPLFAQVSPGNAQSLRAFLAAGYRPIGSEVLFP